MPNEVKEKVVVEKVVEKVVTRDEHYCVVCGMGSTREDWQSDEDHACDSHTPEEVAAAKEKKAEAAKEAQPAAAPASAEKAQEKPKAKETEHHWRR